MFKGKWGKPVQCHIWLGAYALPHYYSIGNWTKHLLPLQEIASNVVVFFIFKNKKLWT
jgi:hypothetical protein